MRSEERARPQQPPGIRAPQMVERHNVVNARAEQNDKDA